MWHPLNWKIMLCVVEFYVILIFKLPTISFTCHQQMFWKGFWLGWGWNQNTGKIYTIINAFYSMQKCSKEIRFSCFACLLLHILAFCHHIILSFFSIHNIVIWLSSLVSTTTSSVWSRENLQSKTEWEPNQFSSQLRSGMHEEIIFQWKLIRTQIHTHLYTNKPLKRESHKISPSLPARNAMAKSLSIWKPSK